MKKKIPLLALAAWLAASCPAWGEPVPPLLHYQGSLPDSEAGGAGKRMTFNLYEAADATVPVWGPQHFDNVIVVKGRFGVLLGTTDAQGRSLGDAAGTRERYLGISVDGRELPRQRILTALSSMSPPGQPQTAAVSPATESPSPASQQVPAGTIVAYWSSRAPGGWLPCDGSPVPEGSEFDELRAMTGPRLPDLRGLFLRGLGQNGDTAYRYGGDAARTLGQLQPDGLKSHEHPFDDFTFSENSGVAPGKAWGQAGRSDLDNSPASPFRHATAAAGGEETRPKNAAVYWIIKY